METAYSVCHHSLTFDRHSKASRWESFAVRTRTGDRCALMGAVAVGMLWAGSAERVVCALDMGGGNHAFSSGWI